MNIEHLRRALKSEWLNYYRTNRHWIVRLGVWVNCQGQRRPSASFILGSLSTLDPQLTQLLPLVVDLNSNPDRIIMVLGLNFNPEDELPALEEAETAGIAENPFSEQLPERAIDQAPAKQLAAQSTQLPEPMLAQPAPQTAPPKSPTPTSVEPAAQPPVDSSAKLLSGTTSSPLTIAASHRIPIDTAQLNTHELPDRDISSTRRSSRNRRKARMD